MNFHKALLFLACCCVAVLSATGTRTINSRFSIGNITYEASADRLTWWQAKNVCRQKGMWLVSIETAEEFYGILDNIAARPEDSFWTSGTCTGRNWGDFYWASTGHTFGPFAEWGYQQPSNYNGNENCVELSRLFQHYLNDETCDFIHYYICESDPCENLK